MYLDKCRRTASTTNLLPGWRLDPRRHLSCCPIFGVHFSIHKAPERQAAVQGKLSTGRVVGQNPVTAWTPGQMAGASSTSWRAIPPHSEAVHSRAVKRTADSSTEAASAKRPKGPETTTQPWQFKEQVDDAVRQLHKKRENAPDDLSFCLAVIDTDTALSRNLDSMKADMTSDDYNSCLQHSTSEMMCIV